MSVTTSTSDHTCTCTNRKGAIPLDGFPRENISGSECPPHLVHPPVLLAARLRQVVLLRRNLVCRLYATNRPQLLRRCQQLLLARADRVHVVGLVRQRGHLQRIGNCEGGVELASRLFLRAVLPPDAVAGDLQRDYVRVLCDRNEAGAYRGMSAKGPASATSAGERPSSRQSQSSFATRAHVKRTPNERLIYIL